MGAKRSSERDEELAGASEEGHGAVDERSEERRAISSMLKPVDLKGLQGSKTIFQDLNAEKKQPKESGFLKMAVSRDSAPGKGEIPGVVFKAAADLHRFEEEWETIGMGVVYVTENQEKRCFFIRNGVMMSAFDFLVKYDVRPTKKKLGVCIGVREMVENKCVARPYCVVFKNEGDASRFVEMVKV